MAFFDTTEFKQRVEEYLRRNEPVDSVSEYRKVGTYLNHGVDTQKGNGKEPSIKLIEAYMNNSILDYMLRDGVSWDKFTKINQNWIGDQFNKIFSTGENNISLVLSFSFRFLYEYYLSCGKDLVIELVDIINYVQKNYRLLDPEGGFDYQYTFTSMPIAIHKALFDDKLVEKLVDVEFIYHRNLEIETKVQKYDETWDKKLEERKVKIDALEAKLKDYQQEYNFVGLNDGFKRLSEEKKSELTTANRSSSWWKGVSFLTPFLTLIIVLIFVGMGKVVPYYALIPFTTMFLLSLYYYRVALFEQKSLKAQLLQIDLRMSLCQFIESYSEYSKEIKANNGHSLDKFEDLIFSGLVANEDKLPTTFDGIDQIGKLIQAIKK